MKTKIILAPSILHYRDQCISLEEYLERLSYVVNYLVDKFLDIMDIDYYGLPLNLTPSIEIPESRKSSIINNQVSQLLGKLIKLAAKDYVDIQQYSLAEMCSAPPIRIIQGNEGDAAFLKYIEYIFRSGKQAVLFLGKLDDEAETPVRFLSGNLGAVKDLKKDLYPELYKLYPIDKNESIFCRSNLCKEINSIVENKSLNCNQREKRTIFIEFGDKVADCNNYIYDANLTAINKKRSNCERRVYRLEDNKYYLSLDYESGGFEVFDKNCIHLGQFNFSCKKVKEADPHNHKLYLKY